MQEKKTLLTRKLRRTKEIVRTEQLIQLIAEQDGLMEEFDEQLFKMTAEKIVVSKEHDITFCLYNGLKLTERGGGQDAVAHAKRQMTWFRGMERRGFTIHWIDATRPMEEKVNEIIGLLNKE